MCEAKGGQRPDSELSWRLRALFLKAQSVDPSHTRMASQLRSAQLTSLLQSIPVKE